MTYDFFHNKLKDKTFDFLESLGIENSREYLYTDVCNFVNEIDNLIKKYNEKLNELEDDFK